MPRLFVHGAFIGGCDDVQELHCGGSLSPVIHAQDAESVRNALALARPARGTWPSDAVSVTVESGATRSTIQVDPDMHVPMLKRLAMESCHVDANQCDILMLCNGSPFPLHQPAGTHASLNNNAILTLLDRNAYRSARVDYGLFTREERACKHHEGLERVIRLNAKWASPALLSAHHVCILSATSLSLRRFAQAMTEFWEEESARLGWPPARSGTLEGFCERANLRIRMRGIVNKLHVNSVRNQVFHRRMDSAARIGCNRAQLRSAEERVGFTFPPDVWEHYRYKNGELLIDGMCVLSLDEVVVEALAMRDVLVDGLRLLPLTGREGTYQYACDAEGKVWGLEGALSEPKGASWLSLLARFAGESR